MLVNQPTAKPTRKMSAVGMGGVLSTIAIAVIQNYLGVQLSADEAAIVASLITAIATFLSGYMTKESHESS